MTKKQYVVRHLQAEDWGSTRSEKPTTPYDRLYARLVNDTPPMWLEDFHVVVT